MTKMLWGNVVERAPELDTEGDSPEAWRIVEPCDDTCHHPVHAFGTPRGRQHIEWLTANSPAVTEEDVS